MGIEEKLDRIIFLLEQNEKRITDKEIASQEEIAARNKARFDMAKEQTDHMSRVIELKRLDRDLEIMKNGKTKSWFWW